MLAQEHPDLFAEAVRYEQTHSDGRQYSWTQGETLMELIGRREEILAEHRKAVARQVGGEQRSLAAVLEAVLDDEDDTLPCLACHL
jgi:hypothetical protein